MSAPTPLAYARTHWRREGWGEPADKDQERLWCLFWTNQEPAAQTLTGHTWTRPPWWVEDFVRGVSSENERLPQLDETPQ